MNEEALKGEVLPTEEELIHEEKEIMKAPTPASLEGLFKKRQIDFRSRLAKPVERNPVSFLRLLLRGLSSLLPKRGL